VKNACGLRLKERSCSFHCSRTRRLAAEPDGGRGIEVHLTLPVRGGPHVLQAVRLEDPLRVMPVYLANPGLLGTEEHRGRYRIRQDQAY
jgi:hypothetical protein